MENCTVFHPTESKRPGKAPRRRKHRPLAADDRSVYSFIAPSAPDFAAMLAADEKSKPQPAAQSGHHGGVQ